MPRLPPSSTLFPTRRSSDLGISQCRSCSTCTALFVTGVASAEPMMEYCSGVSWKRRKSSQRSGSLSASGASKSDRKSTRLNSSHPSISYAVFCLKKKTIVAIVSGNDHDAAFVVINDPHMHVDALLAAATVPFAFTRMRLPRHAIVLTVDALANIGRLQLVHWNLQIENAFFFNDTATTEIYTLSLHDALPI